MTVPWWKAFALALGFWAYFVGMALLGGAI
jgi:hypothetical protein